jgi:dATP pyrophosphohydrolase
MARAPFQVLVYPYRKNPAGIIEYALLKRANPGYWQCVAGGGENQETPLEAAKREAFEEAGVSADGEFICLDSVDSIPVIEFKDSQNWGDQLYVIPQYCFGVKANNAEIVLSREHTDYRWLTYEKAYKVLKYDADRTALWELNQKLTGRGPRD